MARAGREEKAASGQKCQFRGSSHVRKPNEIGGKRPLLPPIAAVTRQAYGRVMTIVQWVLLYLKHYHFAKEGGKRGGQLDNFRAFVGLGT